MPEPTSTLKTSQVLVVTVITVGVTFLSNIIFHFIKSKLDWFDSTKKFKREHSYIQLKELYLEIYAIISQSEFIRDFFEIQGDFDDIPFIEIERKRVTRSVKLPSLSVEGSEYTVKDAMTEFNKAGITEKIIEKRQYASQGLLKNAVAYRFVHEHYLDETLDEEMLKKFQEQELKLIGRMVRKIVIECNQKLKDCYLDYDKKELSSGVLEHR